VRTVETCVYPYVVEEGAIAVMLRRSTVGSNVGRWVPIGGLVPESAAPRDAAISQCAELHLQGQLELAGLVTETSSSDWSIILCLFRMRLATKLQLGPDEVASSYAWFSLNQLSELTMPQSDSRFDYIRIFAESSLYEARMRFDYKGRLVNSSTP
jgi:hypothetical protein